VGFSDYGEVTWRFGRKVNYCMELRNSVFLAYDVCFIQFQSFSVSFIPLDVAFLLLMCISGLMWSISFTTVIYISIRVTNNVIRELQYRARPYTVCV
jgi:uncharacterized membrane protein YesL